MRRWLLLRAVVAAAGMYSLFGADAPGATNAATCHLLWEGEPKTVFPGVWGRMVRLTNAEWLGVSARLSRSNSTLQIHLGGPTFGTRHSGATNDLSPWTLISEVIEPDRFLDNGELIQLPDGSVLLTGRSVVDGFSYRLPVYRSEDAGRTWTNWSSIDSSEGAAGTMRGRGLWEPKFFTLTDGRLAVAYANEKRSLGQPAFSQVCSQKISRDHGRTWGPEITIAAEPGGGSLRPGMPVVTRLKDGRFLAVYEVAGKGDADVYCKLSANAETWSPGLGQLIPGHHAAPWVIALADGRLLLTSCANTLSCSHDSGQTWHTVSPAPWNIPPGKVFTWPALYDLGGGRILATISRRGIQVRAGELTE